MGDKRRSGLTLALLLSLFLSPALATDVKIPANVLIDPMTDSWPTNGGNLYNQRYARLDQIHTSNVARLKGVWHAYLNGSGVGPPFSGEAQSLVHDGVLYVITGADDVFAISGETG